MNLAGDKKIILTQRRQERKGNKMKEEFKKSIGVSAKKAIAGLERFNKSAITATKALANLQKVLNRPSIKLAMEIEEFYHEAVKTNFPSQFRRTI